MERRHQHATLAAQDGSAIDRGQDVDLVADGLHHWRTDEHGMQGTVAESRYVEVGLERVDLAAEGIAADGDVDGVEAALVTSPIEDLAAEQDHAGTGAERRHPRLEPLRHWLEQARRLEQHRHG